MSTFTNQNLQNIKTIFREKTGVELSAARPARRVWRAALVAAALVCLLAVTGFGVVKFSDLAGDELGFLTCYEGDGIVTIHVENRSDKILRFQEKLKLMRWSTGEEILPFAGDVTFEGTEIAPCSTGTMTIDLSGAYDLSVLEQPLTDDHYYFVLTNNNFVFGQDWMCSVKFAEPIITPVAELPEPEPDAEIVAKVTETLRFYFESSTLEPADRRAMTVAYVAAYEELLAEFKGTVITSVDPFELMVDADLPEGVLGEDLTLEQRRERTGLHRRSMDEKFKLLATEDETALTISAVIPQANHEALPLLYLLTYEKAAVTADAYAFIYGQLVTFNQLEDCKVYEDEQYVCYEVSSFVYSDLNTYLDAFAAQRPNAEMDAAAYAQVESVYRYFRAHLPDLFYYR